MSTGQSAGPEEDLRPMEPAAPLPKRPRCLRCNFEVPRVVLGCKNPCPNCGTIYPLGDCSD